jgi:hypothetical protein
VDGGGQEGLWRDPAGHRRLARFAGDSGGRADAGLGLLLIVPAIYLHALDPLPPHAKGWQRFWKGIGIVMLLFGAAMLLGTLAGSRDPLQPLSVLRSNAASGESRPLAFTRVRSLAELESRMRRRATGAARLLRRLVRIVQGDGTFHLCRCARAGQARRAGPCCRST